jgi:hypothetical protein
MRIKRYKYAPCTKNTKQAYRKVHGIIAQNGNDRACLGTVRNQAVGKLVRLLLKDTIRDSAFFGLNGDLLRILFANKSYAFEKSVALSDRFGGIHLYIMSYIMSQILEASSLPRSLLAAAKEAGVSGLLCNRQGPAAYFTATL